jgi:murein DD-endopeptidase MepM/ murein hydrolase activator NlpD
VNESARKARHQRVLAKTSILKPFSLPNIGAGIRLRGFFKKGKYGSKNIDATNALLKKYSAVVAMLFIASTITPAGAFQGNALEGNFQEYAVASFGASLVADDDGYLTKINPQTNKGDRSSMTDKATHTVQSGETLSVIAESYGISTSTLLWENGLSNANALKIGQKLVVPPVNGISHTVAKGETVEKIAAKYSVEADAIIKQNKLLADSTLSSGQVLFIPGAVPIAPPRTDTYRTDGRSVSVGTPVTLADATSVPIGSKPFIFPTRGKITQGFHKGHYAIDIADNSKPPVWAAGTGKVTKASSGTWGGGYGNHIIIDHGNGLQTLYAHLDYLTVSVGDIVDQGQVIGRMGKTGRVYGRTGIHLHFEVIKNGVKQLPSNYY